MPSRGSSHLGLLVAAGALVTPALTGCSNGVWQDDYSPDRCYIGGEDMTMSCGEKSSSASCGMRLSTSKYVGQGLMSMTIKAAPGPGVATTFYLSTNKGLYDMSAPWNEIDFEILGNTASASGTKVWTNLFTGTGEEHHEMISLPYDVSADFHTYTFDLSESSIKWLVDGVVYRTQDISYFSDVKGAITGYHLRPFVSLWGKTQSDSFVACPEFMEAIGRLDWNNNAFPLHAVFKSAWNPPISTTTPGPPVPASECGLSERDTDYLVENEWWRQIDDIFGPGKCCALCEEHAPDCKSWTWFPNQCWLKGDAPGKKKYKATLVSGLPRPMSTTSKAPNTTAAPDPTTSAAATSATASTASTTKPATTSKATTTTPPTTTPKPTTAPNTTTPAPTTQPEQTTSKTGEDDAASDGATGAGSTSGLNSTELNATGGGDDSDSVLIEKFQLHLGGERATNRRHSSSRALLLAVVAASLAASAALASACHRLARPPSYEELAGSTAPLAAVALASEEGREDIQT